MPKACNFHVQMPGTLNWRTKHARKKLRDVALGQLAGCEMGLPLESEEGEVPHLRLSQAPPLPWPRPGSADTVVRSDSPPSPSSGLPCCTFCFALLLFCLPGLGSVLSPPSLPPFLSFVLPPACCVLPLPVLCLCCFPCFPLVACGWLSLFPPSFPPPACVCVKPKNTDLLRLVFFRLSDLFIVRNRQDIVTFLIRLMQCHSVEHLVQWC